MKYLRLRRLVHAHRELLDAAPGTAVSDVARRWGFWHLGRFAAQYGELFGERPFETRRRARRERS